jgi:RNA polymerase sigma-70 factor, ECF subfamily
MTTLTATRREHPAPDEHTDRDLRDPSPVLLDRDRLPDHIDALYRAARALGASRPDAEDLVQETYARVLKRPRFIRRDHELGYLLRALRNTYYSYQRAEARRPATITLPEDVASTAPEASFRANEVMQAVATAPPAFRDAVIAVDLLGMSYKEAARALRARQATLTTRLHRGRQHIARILADAGET